MHFTLFNSDGYPRPRRLHWMLIYKKLISFEKIHFPNQKAQQKHLRNF